MDLCPDSEVDMEVSVSLIAFLDPSLFSLALPVSIRWAMLYVPFCSGEDTVSFGTHAGMGPHSFQRKIKYKLAFHMEDDISKKLHYF